MTPFNTNTQDLSYGPHKHQNFLSLTPTELQDLQSDTNKCHPQMTFSNKILSTNQEGTNRFLDFYDFQWFLY
jgi:hypothetical protein